MSPKVDELRETKVGILLVEDNADDAFFILSELKKSGIAHVARTVSQREQFVSALAEFKPDLVLSDYKLPEFAELEPLRLVRERSPELPFILVTGALGEELSVEVIKEGATDYILKDRLFRLVPAVQRALREAEERRRRREADELLKKQHGGGGPSGFAGFVSCRARSHSQWDNARRGDSDQYRIEHVSGV